MRIHRNIRTLLDAVRLPAWVYQIARNVVHDHQRKATRSTLELADAEPMSDDDREPQPACPTITWLDEMIQTLPDGYRHAVQMAEIEERSQQEVAELPASRSQVRNLGFNAEERC